MMNILISLNTKYVMPAEVMLTSLFMHNNPENIRVYCLYDGLGQEALNELSALAAKHKATFSPIKADGSIFESYPRVPYTSVETYFRFLAGKYLPGDVNRVLWLDPDIVVTGDILELYNTDMGDNVFAACAHSDASLKEFEEHCRLLGLKKGSVYFNAGVLLLNLEKYRETDIFELLEAKRTEISVLEYADQDLLNVLFEGKIKLLNAVKYNLMVNDPLLLHRYEENPGGTAIIHYVGKRKPWIISDAPLGNIWEYYYGQSPYAGRKINRINQSGMVELSEKIAQLKLMKKMAEQKKTKDEK